MNVKQKVVVVFFIMLSIILVINQVINNFRFEI